jgi:hypothetical protein
MPIPAAPFVVGGSARLKWLVWVSFLTAWLWTLANPTPAIPAEPLNIYVAADGDDRWSGTLSRPNPACNDGPLATLKRARDELRRRKRDEGLPHGAIVQVRRGVYRLPETFTLAAEDSGTASAEIMYRAASGERVVISGGREIEQLRPVDDAKALAQLVAEARGHVRCANLDEAGVTDLGAVVAAGKRLEVFYNDKPMTLARGPNHGFLVIAELTGDEPITTDGVRGNKIGRFTVTDERVARWANEPELWLHGYWFWDWADSYEKVQAIDPHSRELRLAPPNHGYGYRQGQRFYALNALAELDTAGEWYLDRQTRRLYLWPPETADEAHVVVSVLPSLIACHDVSHVAFRGLTLAASRDAAVVIDGGHAVRVLGCTIRNTGGWAARVGGTGHVVAGCDVMDVGEGGIDVSGGDRVTLTPGRVRIENNHFQRFGRWFRTYRPAIAVAGVGHSIVHNLIHDAPHAALLFGGNDHLIEGNEIYDVCYETADVGAMYTGRDWTMRGTLIQGNYLHHIQGPGAHSAMAVYLDDAASGMTIRGNVFYKAGQAAFIGGGRDNLVENNLFVDCESAIHVDARGLGWMRNHIEEDMPAKLNALPYQKAPWSERYPTLVNLLADDPGAPKGNVVRRNVQVGGTWADIESAAEKLVSFTDNLVDQDPGFVDGAQSNFQLRNDSPAFQLGFERIDCERIGLFGDVYRASWPVCWPRDFAVNI